MAVQALQAPTRLCGGPGLVAQGPRVPLLALAAVGKGIEGHALPVDTPVGTEKNTLRTGRAQARPTQGAPPPASASRMLAWSQDGDICFPKKQNVSLCLSLQTFPVHKNRNPEKCNETLLGHVF